MIGIIVQARLGSTRLPGKMMLPFFQNKGILELLIDKLQKNYTEYPIVIATTLNKKDDEIERLANIKKLKCYRGSENNVLERFTEAAKKFEIEKIIRICADNPFLNLKELDKLISIFLKYNADYVSFITKDATPIIKTHYGLWAEAITLDALSKIETSNMFYQEHVTNYVYEHTEKFRIKWIPIGIEDNNIRLTTDTREDFELNQEIYTSIKGIDSLDVSDLIKYISRNKVWISRMFEQINKNKK
jgi:spore coat polysaccharide biosynthesis protein SpsF